MQFHSKPDFPVGIFVGGETQLLDFPIRFKIAYSIRDIYMVRRRFTTLKLTPNPGNRCSNTCISMQKSMNGANNAWKNKFVISLLVHCCSDMKISLAGKWRFRGENPTWIVYLRRLGNTKKAVSTIRSRPEHRRSLPQVSPTLP